MAESLAVRQAARALFKDATKHIRPKPAFDKVPWAIRAEWERKASLALAAARGF